jgi:hypothetical protein
MNTVGSLRWNINLGIFAMIVTGISSWGNNLLSTTVIRALIAFVVFFIVTYIFRMFISFLLDMDSHSDPADQSIQENNTGKGTKVDWVTPNDDSTLLNKSEHDDHEESNEFQSMNPSDLAKALRTLADK